MFKNFKSNFIEFSSVENQPIEMKNIPFKYSELLLEFGGKSFDNGLYTIHTFQESLKWTKLISVYFQKFKGELLSFGHDWMGRQFCVPTNSKECILVFDPATIEDFYVEDDLLSFHNIILSTDKEKFFAADLFEQALDYLKMESIFNNQCLGFKTPLFLGGKEDILNYEVCNIEVYWDFEYQLYQQIKNLPDGTKINDIVVNPFNTK